MLLLAACDASTSDEAVPAPDHGSQAEESPGRVPLNSGSEGQDVVTREGRIEQGTECPVLHTPDGEIWALGDTGDHAKGDYVEVTGKVADASFCMQGKGTITPTSIEAKEPPARDRDPAQAGGIAVTGDYVKGSWVAKGVRADCSKPDFTVTLNANGMGIIKASVNGAQQSGAVDVGQTPALHFDAPLPALPIETRGPDGLAVMPPENGNTVTLGGHAIEGDGVVFVKCA